MRKVGRVKKAKLSLCIVVGIIIVLMLVSGCVESPETEILGNSGSVGSSGSSGTGSGSCRPGYAKYTTSEGHCCQEGYPYFYDNLCHQCIHGYNKYDTSAGHCCPAGYPHYFDGTCHQCPQGYYKYDTSAGHCCQEGYPYYADGKCYTQSPGYSPGTNTVVVSDVQVDSRPGCPAQSNLQCSQWITAGRCQIQSCTCYYSGLHGDTAAAYYHTSDGAYFRCSGAGQTLHCTEAAAAAAQHCT